MYKSTYLFILILKERNKDNKERLLGFYLFNAYLEKIKLFYLLIYIY